MGKVRNILFAVLSGLMLLGVIGVAAHDLLADHAAQVRLLAADPPGNPPPPPLPRA
jgi:hypothetical protein